MTGRRAPRRKAPERRGLAPWQRVGLAVGLAVAVPAAAVATWVFGFGSSEAPGPPSAVIVDHLSLTVPNEEFRQEATSLLEGAGYAVDYFPGEDVNVEFYRRLPSRGYDLVVFRVHSDRIEGEWQGEPVDEAILFSSQPYSEDLYVDEQGTKQLTLARYFEGGEPYFGISPDFIEKSMQGDFDDATIIMMGCEGNMSERTAAAFVEAGANAYVGWDETVSATHTDAATLNLLQKLLVDDLPIEQAVDQTMGEVGPDPVYESSLRVYPSEASS